MCWQDKLQAATACSADGGQKLPPLGLGGVWRSVITCQGGDAQGVIPSVVGRPCPGPAASGDGSIGSVAVWQPPWQAAQESPGQFTEAPGASGWGLFLTNTWTNQRDMDHKEPASIGPSLSLSPCTVQEAEKWLDIKHLGFGQGL